MNELTNRTLIGKDEPYQECSERVGFSSSNWRGNRCSHRATVSYTQIVEKMEKVPTGEINEVSGMLFEDKPVKKTVLVKYCRIHDPEYQAAKRTKKYDEWQKEVGQRNVLTQKLEALIKRLGCGRVEWEKSVGPTGSITIHAESVERLLKELGR